MTTRLILGYLLAFIIGALCQIAGVPLPAPPALLGALIVCSMTLGYLSADRFLAHREAKQRDNSGGSFG